MSYEWGDYLLIRDDKVIAVSGNVEFYEDFPEIEYVKGDTVVRVVICA
jgi:hypothetical protein